MLELSIQPIYLQILRQQYCQVQVGLREVSLYAVWMKTEQANQAKQVPKYEMISDIIDKFEMDILGRE